MVDYATKYPDVAPLKKIDTEAVAKALLDMYTRPGFPEEFKRNKSSQFTSDCMKKVTRLLNIRQLVTATYRPMCNGLVGKFNQKLKAMLRRLCCVQPKQWYAYIF